MKNFFKPTKGRVILAVVFYVLILGWVFVVGDYTSRIDPSPLVDNPVSGEHLLLLPFYPLTSVAHTVNIEVAPILGWIDFIYTIVLVYVVSCLIIRRKKSQEQPPQQPTQPPASPTDGPNMGEG